MTDQDPTDEARDLPPLRLPAQEPAEPAPARRRVLGVIPPGEADTSLGARGEEQASTRNQPGSAEAAPVRQVSSKSRRRQEASESRPTLPRGGLVALRRSGGIVFRTSEITVYRDGRVTYDADGAGQAREKAVWLLTDAELRELRQQLDEIDFEAHRFAHGRQSPDSYAYELVVRVGRRVQRLELAEGSIPEAVEPLVRTLARYAPPADY